MQQLESITIKSLNRECQKRNIQQRIWSMIAVVGCNQLRYLNVPLQTICKNRKQLSYDPPSLECATLNNISDKEMFVFLRHTPDLCSLTTRIDDFCSAVDLTDLNFIKLTYLNIRLENKGSFNSLHQFLYRCPNLIDFEFRCWTAKVDWKMTEPDHWQNLITQCLPQFLYLNVRFYRYMTIESDPHPRDQFENSDFWRNRQPDFTITVRSSESKYTNNCFSFSI